MKIAVFIPVLIYDSHLWNASQTHSLFSFHILHSLVQLYLLRFYYQPGEISVLAKLHWTNQTKPQPSKSLKFYYNWMSEWIGNIRSAMEKHKAGKGDTEWVWGWHSKQGGQEKRHRVAFAQRPVGSKGGSHLDGQQTHRRLSHLPLGLPST